MISKIDAGLQNYSYNPQINKRTFDAFAPKSIQDSVSFSGREKTLRTAIVNSLEKIKSKIVHNVIVISGPSGAGKDTIINAIKKKEPNNFKNAISYTTRKMREGEVNGKNYHFISEEQFQKMNEKGEFFNQACIDGREYGGTVAHYGGTLAELNSKIRGNEVFLNMSSEEACKVKDIYKKKAVLIFVSPPNKKELENRLNIRGTETVQEIKKRLDYGDQQMECADTFDKVIVNDNLDTAVDETMRYINKRRSVVLKVVNNLLDTFRKN